MNVNHRNYHHLIFVPSISLVSNLMVYSPLHALLKNILFCIWLYAHFYLLDYYRNVSVVIVSKPILYIKHWKHLKCFLSTLNIVFTFRSNVKDLCYILFKLFIEFSTAWGYKWKWLSYHRFSYKYGIHSFSISYRLYFWDWKVLSSMIDNNLDRWAYFLFTRE